MSLLVSEHTSTHHQKIVAMHPDAKNRKQRATPGILHAGIWMRNVQKNEHDVPEHHIGFDYTIEPWIPHCKANWISEWERGLRVMSTIPCLQCNCMELPNVYVDTRTCPLTLTTQCFAIFPMWCTRKIQEIISYVFFISKHVSPPSRNAVRLKSFLWTNHTTELQ